MKKTKIVRFEFIEFLLRFRGWVTRRDVTTHFDTRLAGTSNDFADYRALTPLNGDPHDSRNFFNSESRKGYEAKFDTFEPHFTDLSSDKALAFLRNEYLKGSLGDGKPVPIHSPFRLGMPDIEVLATISRAILNNKGLDIEYHSLKNGQSQRIIIPHSIVDTGTRWYVRSYCTRHEKFVDFVIPRMTKAKDVNIIPETSQSVISDQQWNAQVTLSLVPHPNRDNFANAETIDIEGNMKNGKKVIILRAAEVGYWLQLWNVDCSKEATAKGSKYLYWLENNEILREVDNSFLAPKFKSADM
jgi:hypothetical protein